MGEPKLAECDDVEISPEMIRRGMYEILAYDPEFDGPEAAVIRILNAVLGREVMPLHEGSHVSTDLTDFFGDLSKAIHRHWFVENAQPAARADALTVADIGVVVHEDDSLQCVGLLSIHYSLNSLRMSSNTSIRPSPAPATAGCSRGDPD